MLDDIPVSLVAPATGAIPSLSVTPAIKVAVVKLGRRYARELHVSDSDGSDALAAVADISRARLYQLIDVIEPALATLVRSIGRPPNPPPTPEDRSVYLEITGKVLEYVMDNPGCVRVVHTRRRYSDGFRAFLTTLCASYNDLSLETFAHAAHVPQPTITEWRREPRTRAVTPSAADEGDDDDGPPATLAPAPVEGTAAATEPVVADLGQAQIRSVLTAWKTWDGDFKSFGRHTRDELRLPFGLSALSKILFVEGARKPHKRPGRTPDEIALRGAFVTFFPGAQWVGDGMQVGVALDGERFALNMELNVDAYSGAFVGVDIRVTEDSAAVIAAFRDGVACTGAAPLALLLDNKPSNHVPDVHLELAPSGTLLIPATVARPQNKGHVEGAFGLFSQTVPPIALPDGTPLARAIALLALIATTFARAFNHRPRVARGGRSRFELYRDDAPTQEQIDQAREALKERLRLQVLRRQTALARADIGKMKILDEAFQQLGLLDPNHSIRLAIARYPEWAIKQGIGRFRSKKDTGSLPDDVDGRYLLGIVHNITSERELEIFAEELLYWRLRHRDIHLDLLATERETARAAAATPSAVVLAMVDKYLLADRVVDRTFWLTSAVAALDLLDPAARLASLAEATPRIRFARRVPIKDRQALIARLTEHAVPEPGG